MKPTLTFSNHAIPLYFSRLKTAMSSLSFAGAASYDYEEDAIQPEQIKQWKAMGAVALALLAVVGYYYQVKIYEPMQQMAPSVESQLVTEPVHADEAQLRSQDDAQNTLADKASSQKP